VPAVTTRAQRKGRIQSRLSPRIRQGPGHGIVAKWVNAAAHASLHGRLRRPWLCDECGFKSCRSHLHSGILGKYQTQHDPVVLWLTRPCKQGKGGFESCRGHLRRRMNMKINPCKLCREPYSRGIQHLKAVKITTKAASRRFRRQTKVALKLGREPPVTFTGGERF